MVFQGQARQDEFVANILNFKENGHFLDVGSCHAISTNNTYHFESLNWRGVCIEKNAEHNQSYNERKCHFLNEDATKIDYSALLKNRGYPSQIDYLSLDIDDESTTVLKKLPLDKFRFSVITIEHDFYIHGGIFRDAQRQILKNYGYVLLFGDVLVPHADGMGPNLAFEDWWVDHTTLDENVIRKITAEKLYPEQILSLVRNNGS
jgi:hypothetical protein